MPRRLQVNKPVAQVAEFERLFNDCKQNSFNVDERKVDFAALNELGVRFAGLYGGNAELLAALQRLGAHLRAPSESCRRTLSA